MILGRTAVVNCSISPNFTRTPSERERGVPLSPEQKTLKLLSRDLRYSA